jgi:hypothetical protein
LSHLLQAAFPYIFDFFTARIDRFNPLQFKELWYRFPLSVT